MASRDGIRWTLVALAGVLVAIVVSSLTASHGRAAAVPLSIKVSGNHFVDGGGQTIRLLGANTPSAEYTCAQGNGYDDGAFTDADAAALASWHINAVRIPLNEDCWLGLNGYPDSTPDNPATQAGYQQDIKSWVQTLNNHGIYAILDLHWSAPGHQTSDSQQPMPDADHSVDFWSSVASIFKSNPAVVFDLFNEPFDPTDPRSGDDTNPNDTVSWSCWENGGCTTQSYKDQENDTGVRYTTAGMQSLVTAVRATGATQPVLVGGLNFANDLSQWAQHAPTDPLNQEAASFHNYMGEACATQACWDSTIAPVAANVPVVTGEFAEDNFLESTCPDKTDSGFDTAYMNWADQHGVSYLAWAWYVLTQSEKDGQKCEAYYLSDDYNGTPAAPNGTVVHDHLAALASAASAGTPVTTASTPVTTASTTTSMAPTATATASTPATSPPGTTGGRQQTQAPALSRFSVKSRSVATSLAVSLRTDETCTGVLSGSTVRAYRTAGHPHAKRVSLGSVAFSLRPGITRALTLKLAPAARHLLTAHRTLRVQVVVTLTNSAGRRLISRHTLTLSRRHPGT